MIWTTLRRFALAGAVAGIGGLALAGAASPATAQLYYPYCSWPYYNPYYCYGYSPDYVWLGGGWGWGGGHNWRGGYGGHFAARGGFGGGGRMAMAHRGGGGHFGGGHHR
jgi:hypothetical protein